MKKLLLASLGVFFLSVSVALAGGFGGCSYNKSSLELTDTHTTNNAIVLLQLDNKRVELASTSAIEVRYNVKTQQGEELANNLSLEDLSSQFPKLYQALKG